MKRRTLTQTLVLPLAAALLCSAAVRCDKSTNNPDLATGADLAVAVDLASPADQTSQPPDLTPPADLTPPVDLAGTPGDRCLIALELPTDNTARDGTNVGFSDDYQFTNIATACKDLSGMYKGKDVAYAVTVPTGKTLTVTLSPKFALGTWYPMLALVSDCAQPGPSCLSAQDTVIPNSKDRVVTYQNTDTASRSLFVLVDTFDAAGTGQYSIEAALN